MAKIRLEVNGESAKATVTEGILTHGAVGVVIDVIVSGAQWEGIPYKVVCVCNGVAREALAIDGVATVPHECMIGGYKLQIGLDSGNQPGPLRIPTVLASCGTVAKSTASVDAGEPVPPTPDIYSQIMAAIDAGKIRGLDGYSPTVGVTIIAGGYHITITDKDGEKSFDLLNGHDGDDYVLTDADKMQIAGMVKPYDDTAIKKEQIALKQGLTQCLKEPDGMAVGKYFCIAAIDENGHAVLEAADLPVTNGSVYGVCKTSTNYGTAAINGEIRLNPASQGNINTRTTFPKPIVSSTIDYVVKAAMTDGKGAAWTPEEQLAGRQRLGLDKEWIKVGTLTTDNKDTGVTVDLTGCTELIVVGYTSGTGYSNLMFNDYNSAVYRIFTNGGQYNKYYWVDMFGAATCISGSFNGGTDANPRNMQTNSNGFNLGRGLKIADIVKVSFNTPGNGTECSLEIWAR